MYGHQRPQLVDHALVDNAVRHATEIEHDIVPLLDLLRRVELRTFAYHRELIGTRPVDDPHLGGFMHRWAAEEMEHGRVLSLLVEHFGYPSAEEQVALDAEQCLKNHRRTVRRNRLLSNIGPTPFLAVHMTVGAMNEWLAHFIYRCLADMTACAPLADLLTALSRQESHHAGQYRTRAAQALDSSRLARHVVRRYVKATWQIVGSDVIGEDGHHLIYAYVARHREWQHALDVCDDRISRLPGLGDVRPYNDAHARFVSRAGAITLDLRETREYTPPATSMASR